MGVKGIRNSSNMLYSFYSELKQKVEFFWNRFSERTTSHSWFTSFFWSTVKAEETTPAPFEHEITAISPFQYLPNEVLENIYSGLEMKALCNVAQVMDGVMVREAKAQRLQKYGYHGKDLSEGKLYIQKKLLEPLAELLKRGVIPSKYWVYKGTYPVWRYIDAKATFVKLINLSGEEKNRFKNKLNKIFILYAQEGLMDLVKVLLVLGADLNATTILGNTALALAACSGKKEMVIFLIENGADTDTANQSGQTPLMLAISKGRAEIVECLLNNATPKMLNDLGSYLDKALRAAAYNGNIALVKVLIKYGANIEARSKKGCTALVKAVTTGEIEVVKYLIEKGANVNAKNNKNETPLTIITDRRYRYLEIKKLFESLIQLTKTI